MTIWLYHEKNNLNMYQVLTLITEWLVMSGSKNMDGELGWKLDSIKFEIPLEELHGIHCQ